ncbi:MAG: T9SS type A sorting domain-containing protein [Prevotellaceae bacterium]|jgi:predicted outer membrane repeat protein|nr:T9SS type A sorting domain-containing protein [Prevotellaceae bacterium]
MSKLNFLTLSLCCALCQASFAATYRVKPSGNNAATGASWNDALASPAAALLRATSGDQIWMACGLYVDSVPLLMRGGVSVYGGFTGTETSLAARPTTVLGGSQMLNPALVSVLLLSGGDSTAVLLQLAAFDVPTVWDGFSISGGNNRNKGGGVCLQENGVLRRCNIVSNHSRRSGGGVLCEYGGTLQGCYVANNTADEFGGGIYSHGGKITGGTIANNTATYDGGGVYSTLGTVADSVNITGNNASGDGSPARTFGNGGGVYSNYADLWRSCTVANNRATDGNGGGFYLNGGAAIRSCNVLNNYSKYSGGGIWCEDGALMDSCTIASNQADGHGGGIYLNGGTVSSSIFSQNKSLYGRGGGINMENYGEVWACTFYRNEAGVDGGGIYIDLNGKIVGCTFTENLAQRDGGGFAYSSLATIDSCTLTANQAQHGGGATAISSILGTISNSTFANNHAAQQGGGLYGGNSVQRCTFVGNIADADGGGIYNESGASKIYACRLYNNRAVGNGGGLVLDKAGTVASCVVTNNEAANGGGFYGSRSVVAVNCTLARNKASQYGGGAYLTNGAALANSTVWGNNSTIYLADGKVTYCAVDGATAADTIAGEGNIRLSTGNNDNATTSPAFINPSNTVGNTSLSDARDALWTFPATSNPCYNKGSNASVPQDCNVDVAGKPRIYDKTVDIGAHEWIPAGYTGIGAQPAPALAGLRIYPNPAADVVYVALPDDVSGEVQLQIYDLQGRLLLRRTAYGNATVSLSLVGLPNAILVLRVANGGRAGGVLLLKK